MHENKFRAQNRVEQKEGEFSTYIKTLIVTKCKNRYIPDKRRRN